MSAHASSPHGIHDLLNPLEEFSRVVTRKPAASSPTPRSARPHGAHPPPPTVSVSEPTFDLTGPDPGSRGAGGIGYQESEFRSASPSPSSCSFSQHTSPAPAYALPPSKLIASYTPLVAVRSSVSDLPQATVYGSNVDIPTDWQIASKAADEKRKRNAGASARFRQRRKEKDREISSKFSKLEEQIRELTGQRNFYHFERNLFREELRMTGRTLVRPGSPGTGSAPWRTSHGSVAPPPATIPPSPRPLAPMPPEYHSYRH